MREQSIERPLWALFFVACVAVGIYWKAESKATHETTGVEVQPDDVRCKRAIEARKKRDYVGMIREIGLSDSELFEGDKALFWQLTALAEKAGK